jgi:hypothetical protein
MRASAAGRISEGFPRYATQASWKKLNSDITNEKISSWMAGREAWIVEQPPYQLRFEIGTGASKAFGQQMADIINRENDSDENTPNGLIFY